MINKKLKKNKKNSLQIKTFVIYFNQGQGNDQIKKRSCWEWKTKKILLSSSKEQDNDLYAIFNTWEDCASYLLKNFAEVVSWLAYWENEYDKTNQSIEIVKLSTEKLEAYL